MSAALPPIVYRVTRDKYARTAADALSGVGGLHDEGRWHSQGRPIVYTGSSTSICLLERLVHADEWIADRHLDRVVLTLRVPDMRFTHYSAAELAAVDPNWREEGNAVCRALGDRWLAQGKYCAIIVPSAADTMASNVLFNPAHPAMAAMIAANAKLLAVPLELDDRVVSLAAHQRRAGKA